MFGKRRIPGQDDMDAPEGAAESESETQGGAAPARPEPEAPLPRHAQRRAAEPAGAAGRRSEQRPPSPLLGAGEGRKLVVGREIRLSGEIKQCEKLVVEGEVEANLNDCLSLEIADTGLFKGAAVVEEAEISGRFEGDLAAKERLYVRSTGRLRGSVRYSDLEIERGGKIAGTVDVIGDDEMVAETPAAQAAPSPVEESRVASAPAPGNGEAPPESAGTGETRLRLDT